MVGFIMADVITIGPNNTIRRERGYRCPCGGEFWPSTYSEQYPRSSTVARPAEGGAIEGYHLAGEVLSRAALRFPGHARVCVRTLTTRRRCIIVAQ
jgi:hypothetical protein